jgi:hypothetical protein
MMSVGTVWSKKRHDVTKEPKVSPIIGHLFVGAHDHTSALPPLYTFPRITSEVYLES